MSGTYTGFPIANVAIPSLPDLGGVTDASMVVGERAGTGRFVVTALRDYVMQTVSAGYATPAYVDAAVATKLPLAGGELTGNLTVPDTLFFSAAGMSLNAGPDYSIWTLDSGNYEVIYSRHLGLLQYRGLGGIELWSVDASGNSKVAGDLTVTAGDLTVTAGVIEASGTIGSNDRVVALGDIYARGGHYYFGSDDRAVLNTDTGGTSLRFSANGWALSWNSSTGTLAFFNNAALPLFTVDAAGNGLFHGSVHGTNVTLLEAKVDQLQTRIAALEARLR